MSHPGDVVGGRFELVARLGGGGMGTVWRARDTALRREVALKEMRPSDPALTTPAAARTLSERVLREARALASLSHPHVVTIHQIVAATEGGHPWIVMELLPGLSLQDRLDQGPLSPLEAAVLGRQILSALRAAHAAGIQHRDVKPANVMLRPASTPLPDVRAGDGPSAVLTDFGIAALRGSSALTATGDLIGSPEYIAPERIRGVDDDPASDLWSLGVVLYVAVEGVSPLRRATTFATLAAVLDEPVPPPVRAGHLTDVLTALLVRDRVARPDAARLDVMLADVVSGAGPRWARPTVTAAAASAPGPRPPAPADAARPVPPLDRAERGTTPTRPARPGRGRAGVVVAAAGVVVALVATTALVLTLRGNEGAGDAAGRSPSPVRTTERVTVPPGKGGTPAGSPASPAASPDGSASTTVPDGGSPTGSGAPASPVPPASEGRWIAQLFSEPVGSGTAVRDRRLTAVRGEVPEAAFLRSDDYASLVPGYWVFYAPGPFGDGRAALDFCARHGLTTRNECLGRYLSDRGDDRVLQCGPPRSKPVGRCAR
ncbi:serine/threonine-protein kinase [Streptomyces tsukubensis]|uniref:non-specific serine/threonine protein kinase n=1 Tax=Streptomyces tsukubensis TaxID=83656 RepID=A0A1V4A7K5_9ACTN|nr:serine/threonine-protein kinase [Streptomyces tsukubensis]OON77614.1 serine/threonine protein kinase [Streptomyces tsukubensis]QFR93117.1 protein kinase [Streptomyces tsukubensis]